MSRRHPLPAHVRRAARAIMQCRTAALGGHIQACPDGHISRIWYNSCRHRSCPQCAYLQTERWLALQQARLLACDHSHVIFTLPHDLNPAVAGQRPGDERLAVAGGARHAVHLTGGPRSISGRSRASLPRCTPGVRPWCCIRTSTAWSRGVGSPRRGTGCAVRNGFLLPVRVVMAVFRGKMLAAIRQACARGELALPEPMRPQQLLNLLNRLGHPTKTPWNVRIMERYRHGAGVVTSLARYLRGGPIKNARLVAWDGDRVTFTYRASAEAQRLGPLSVAHDVVRRGLSPAVAAACAGPPDAGWCGPMGCPITPTLRRSRLSAAWASRPWLSRSRWPGRRCVPNGATRIRNGVRPAVSSWCAPGSSRVEVPRRPCAWGACRMRATPRGTAWQGVVCLVPARWCLVIVLGGCGALRGADTRPPVPQTGHARGHRPDAVGVPWYKLHSVRSEKPGQAASVRGQSNQELKRTPGRWGWGARA